MIGVLLLLWFVSEVAIVVLLVQALGALATLMLAALTSVSGFLMIRGEGLALVRRLMGFMQQVQRTGELPPVPVAQSLPRLIAGALLVVPGFGKDVLALLVLLPPLRGVVVRRVHALVVERHHALMRDRGFIDIDGQALGDEPPPPGEGPERPPLPPRPRPLLPPPEAS